MPLILTTVAVLRSGNAPSDSSGSPTLERLCEAGGQTY